MSDPVVLPEFWVVLIAAFLPLLASLAVKPEGASWVRAAIAASAAIVLAVVQVLTDDQPDTWQSLLTIAGTALGTQLTAYLAVFQHFHINERVAPNIGTSLGGEPSEED